MARKTGNECVQSVFRQSPENLLAFIDHSPTVAYLKDADGRMVYVNRVFEKTFQQPAAAFLGRTDAELWPAEVAQQLRANDVKVLATGEGMETVEQVPTPDGCLRSWLSFKFRVNGDHGEHYLGGMSIDITAREEVQQALTTERHLLQQLMDHIPDIIYFKDRQSRFVRVNRAKAEKCGAHDSSEVIGKTDFDYFTVEHAQQAFDDEQRIIRTGQPIIGKEEKETWPDQRVTWCFSTKVPFRDATGTIIGTVGISRDITDRKEAEDAIRRTEARLRELFEHSPDAIFVEDLTGIVLDCNEAACRLHGLSRQELIGRSCFDLVPADEQVRARTGFPQLSLGGGQTVEGHSLHADGRTVPVELRANRVEYAGRPALLLHVRDITDRKRAGEQLRETESRYQQLVEQLPAITYMAEFGDGRWTYVSPQIESLLGFSIAEWTAEKCPWLEQIHPEDRPQVLAAEARCRETGEPLELEYRIHTRDGRVTWFSDHSVVVRDAAGQPRYLHGVMFDITGRKALEDQLTQAHKMDAVGRLAGGVAHDFNNILTTILGYSELILRRADGDVRIRDNAQEIQKAADRAASLTRQLLAFSRKQTLQPQVVDLNAIVGEMDRMLRRLITEAICLDVRVDSGLWHTKADPGQVQQVIMNLAVNARDAMPSGGTLTIETANVILDEHYVRQHTDACAGEHVMLAISDTGSGISADVKEHLFEPFFTTKGVGQGTGLGLATCYGIVKQSGGHINVYTELGRGTTFKVYLPRATELAMVPAVMPPRAAPCGQERVLLVEDEEAVREMSALVLRDLGYRVVQASDGDEALRLTKESDRESFDLLFTDLVMPRMGGKELAYWFRVTHPSTRVLFTSGYPEKSMAHSGELVAGIAFLHKPYTPDILARKIREVLDN